MEIGKFVLYCIWKVRNTTVPGCCSVCRASVSFITATARVRKAFKPGEVANKNDYSNSNVYNSARHHWVT